MSSDAHSVPEAEGGEIMHAAAQNLCESPSSHEPDHRNLSEPFDRAGV